MRPVAVAFALLLLVVPAQAAPARAERYDPLLALAEVLGQSHALRQACAGPDAQYWRARMARLMDVGRPQGAWAAGLTAAFNDGYHSRRKLFPVCTPAARRAEMTAAARGRNLAGRLAEASRAAPSKASPGEMAPNASPQ